MSLLSGGLGPGGAAQRRVAPFMLPAVAALLLGLWAGLARIGWDLPKADEGLMVRHGALMVVGFVATLIAVERAIAVGGLPALAAPALSAATGVALILGAGGRVAPGLALAAAAAYALDVAVLLLRHQQPPLGLLFVAGVCLEVAAVVWWEGGGVRYIVPWWMAFLLLTVAAERLEIIRFQRFSTATVLAGGAVLALLALGLILSLWHLDAGGRVLGAGVLAAALWLARRDVAGRTVRTQGLARFAAVGVITAYAWLAVAGTLLLLGGFGGGAGWEYDAAVHAFFIGFVISAIIAHAPIIAPAVTGLRFPYTPLFYLPLVLVNGALVVRVLADLNESDEARRWAAMVQALAIVLFLGLVAASLAAGGLRARAGRRPSAGAVG